MPRHCATRLLLIGSAFLICGCEARGDENSEVRTSVAAEVEASEMQPSPDIPDTILSLEAFRDTIDVISDRLAANKAEACEIVPPHVDFSGWKYAGWGGEKGEYETWGEFENRLRTAFLEHTRQAVTENGWDGASFRVQMTTDPVSADDYNVAWGSLSDAFNVFAFRRRRAIPGNRDSAEVVTFELVGLDGGRVDGFSELGRPNNESAAFVETRGGPPNVHLSAGGDSSSISYYLNVPRERAQQLDLIGSPLTIDMVVRTTATDSPADVCRIPGADLHLVAVRITRGGETLYEVGWE